MQDSKLLIAGTISGNNNVITGFNLTGATTAAAVLSPYSVDLNPGHGTGIDLGEGTPIYLKYVIQTTITGATGLTVNIVTDSTAALTATPSVLASQNISALIAGTFGYIQVPPLIASSASNGLGQEFLGASFLALGATVTAGAIIAEFTNVVDDPKTFYASGFAVV
ncbi:hypothetical protein [Methylomonas sp. AM2-LC]|uniref:hypothetical protein n=1 Tax=Methylomonas sp. AM2-LC TaxID=3153301 RepID=UPI003265AA55